MNAPSRAQKVLGVLLATILLVLSGSMAWATVHDYEVRRFVPKGVSVAGTELSGMTAEQARETIESAVKDPLMHPVTVTANGQDYEFNPESAVSVDVDAMIDEAFAPRRSAPFIARMRHDAGYLRFTSEITPRYTVDQETMRAWLRDVSKKVNRRPVDATLTVDGHNVIIKKSQNGTKVAFGKATEVLAARFEGDAALDTESKSIELPVYPLKPKVTEKDFGKVITVDQSERLIRLWKGGKVEKTYRCAIGTAQYPTPLGHFEVVLKRFMPTWVNPAPNGWGKDMPASIPPGPSNPLGTRAINLSASGIRFHGTNNIASVGTAASHGCMRMVRADIEDLFERVEVGTQVYIVP